MIHDAVGAFGDEECDLIIGLAASGQPQPGPVYDASGGRIDPALRHVTTTYRARTAATGWVYDRLDTLFAEAAAMLDIPVGSISEELQIVRYDPGSHFSLWHTDAGADAHAARCISVSVELSAADDYDGGTLEIVPDTIGRPRTLPRGGARFFPSRALHHVTPVTRGVRHALVIWAGAP